MELLLIQILPNFLIKMLAPLALISVGFLVETQYTGRITIFSNAIALVTFFMMFESIPSWAIIYTNLVTVLGLIGVISYKFKVSLFEAYYTFGRMASSLITGLIIIGFSIKL